MNKSGTIFLSFVAGVAAGAALGILYAPDEGKNTRDKISFQLDRYREKLVDMLKKLKDQSELPVSAAKTEGERIISDTKSEAERLLSDVEALMGQINEIKGKGI
jgi:gas vesicle protein